MNCGRSGFLFLNILVGVDGSPSSQRALEYAIELARAERARLTLMTVAPPAASFIMLAGVMPDAMREELDKWAQGQLADSVRTVPAELNAHTVQGRGHPGPEIVKELKRGGLRLDRPRLPWSRAHAGRAPRQRQRLRPLPRTRAAPLGAGRDGDQVYAQVRAGNQAPARRRAQPRRLARVPSRSSVSTALIRGAVIRDGDFLTEAAGPISPETPQRGPLLHYIARGRWWLARPTGVVHHLPAERVRPARLSRQQSIAIRSV